KGKRVAVVDDVINAASAVRKTLHDLHSVGAQPVAIGSLLILGDAPRKFAADANMPIEFIAQQPNNIWVPAECPLCAAGVPLEKFDLRPADEAMSYGPEMTEY